jgi:hypothetical protein
MDTLTKRYTFNAKDHIHLLSDEPLIGTTTALNILAKPLTWWAAGMSCAEFGWLNPKKHTNAECLKAANLMLAKIKGMTTTQYIGLLEKAYRAHNTKKDQAADDGTALHAKLEKFVKAEIEGQPLQVIDPEIQPFVNWSRLNVKQFLFSELYCYSEPMWTGGCADFGYIDMDDRVVLGDFKSSAEAYWSHAVQLGGYDLQISENGGFTATGEKVFTLPRPFEYHAIFAARAGLDKPFFNRKQVLSARNSFAYAVSIYRENMFFEGFER